jgi:hypothetical protein
VRGDDAAALAAALSRSRKQTQPMGSARNSRHPGRDVPLGAVLLTGLASLRVGAGKLTYATVEQNASALGRVDCRAASS